jgi:hypothetical protein
VFSEPYVALADDGTIWVTVPLAREVRAYSGAGRLIRTIGANDAPGVDLRRPAGQAFRPTDGRLLVSDIDGQIAALSVGPLSARPPQAPAPSVPPARPRAALVTDDAHPPSAPPGDAARFAP